MRNRTPASKSLALRAALLLALAVFLPVLLGGCQSGAEARQLAEKARTLWESGRYQDAARNFVTLSELYPSSSLAEESLFWAASLYHHYLHDAELASRYYQHLIVTYPKGHNFFEAKLNLAEVYAENPDTRHRALQTYQQLVLAPEMAPQQDLLRLKIARLNVQLGKMDQARMAVRDLMVNHPKSDLLPQAAYLVGYSYYLEKRYELALYVFRRTAQDFSGTPVALRAQFFVADTLEEQGHMREALKAYDELRSTYPNPDIVEKRIRTLQARIRRGVR